jgi:hypothetical protein
MGSLSARTIPFVHWRSRSDPWDAPPHSMLFECEAVMYCWSLWQLANLPGSGMSYLGVRRIVPHCGIARLRLRVPRRYRDVHSGNSARGPGRHPFSSLKGLVLGLRGYQP